MKYNALITTYAPELGTLGSNFTPVLRGLTTQPYRSQRNATKLIKNSNTRYFPPTVYSKIATQIHYNKFTQTNYTHNKLPCTFRYTNIKIYI